MKREAPYAFRDRMLTLHPADLRDCALLPKPEEWVIPQSVTISLSAGTDPVAETAVSDFMEYLQVSMGITPTRTDAGQISLMLASEAGMDLGDAAGYKGFRIDVSTDGIQIYGFDTRGLAQALYYLEDVMNLRRAPFVPLGTTAKKPLFAPRMVHSGYGLDEFPDAHLAQMAHEGFDVVLVFTTGPNQTPNGPMDFNELVARCGKYGLDVYAYSYIPSKYHPDDPQAQDYYENTYGTLFQTCPGIKGVILVGESVGFPSKDPRVQIQEDGNPHVHFKKFGPASSHFPCCDYPQLVNMIKNTVRQYQKDADIVFWTYNWGYQPEADRIALIEALPDDITLQATFEMFEPVASGGFCSDYTLSFAGPGTYFRTEAIAAAKKGIRLYSMTNSAGLTWDIGTIPYQPMPYQWMRRFQAMRQANADWGLSGIMECHHYGWYPSFISKLEKWFCWNTPVPADILEQIVAAEFGADHVDTVLSALADFSEAITYCVPSSEDQYGSFRVGPAYPFCLQRRYPIPPDPDSRSGNSFCHPCYSDGCDSRIPTILQLRIGKEIDSLETMLQLMEKGVATLSALEGINEPLDLLLNLARYITRCVITGRNIKKWHVLQCKFYAATDAHTLDTLLNEMVDLLVAEKENARQTLPLVDMDSRLGWEPSMRYIGGRRNIEWKMEQVQRIIELDLGEFRICLNRSL